MDINNSDLAIFAPTSTDIIALLPEEDRPEARAALSGAYWTLGQLADAPCSPWILRRIMISLAIRQVSLALIVVEWAAVCVADVAEMHRRARMVGDGITAPRERALGHAGVYVAHAAAGISGLARHDISHVGHAAREWARLAAEFAAAAQHPDAAPAGDDATAREHLRRLARMLDPGGEVWGGRPAQPNRVLDMAADERAAFERLCAAGGAGGPIGGVLPDDDAFHVVTFGWGDDETIPYGRALATGDGHRYIPIDHGTALVARAHPYSSQRAVYHDGTPGPRWSDAQQIAGAHGCDLVATAIGADLECVSDRGDRGAATRAMVAMQAAGIHCGSIGLGRVPPGRAADADNLSEADQRVAAMIADLELVELPAGSEDRAVARWESER